MITRFGVPLPEKDDLRYPPRGVVLHWTGGTGRANEVDVGAYHYVVESDAKVERGRHSVNENMRRLSESVSYAAHTGGWNSFRVGLAGAGMRGYRAPGDAGPYPLTEPQVRRMLELAVHFLRLGDLDPESPRHLCTHREVWTIHGIRGVRNHQKLDIEYLPFRPDLAPDEVGGFLRMWAARIMLEQDMPILGVVPEVVKEPLRVPPMHLREIDRPTPADIDAALYELRVKDDDTVERVMRAVELLGRAVLRGERPELKDFIDAAADWLKRRVA